MEEKYSQLIEENQYLQKRINENNGAVDMVVKL